MGSVVGLDDPLLTPKRRKNLDKRLGKTPQGVDLAVRSPLPAVVVAEEEAAARAYLGSLLWVMEMYHHGHVLDNVLMPREVAAGSILGHKNALK